MADLDWLTLAIAGLSLGTMIALAILSVPLSQPFTSEVAL